VTLQLTVSQFVSALSPSGTHGQILAVLKTITGFVYRGVSSLMRAVYGLVMLKYGSQSALSDCAAQLAPPSLSDPYSPQG
jgi:hypothetical protein